MQTMLTLYEEGKPVSSLDPAIAFARRCNAWLQVLVFGQVAPVPTMVYVESAAYDWGGSFNERIKQTHAAANGVSDYLASQHINGGVIPVCQTLGTLPVVVADHAIYTDFVLVPNVDALDKDVRDRLISGGLIEGASTLINLPEAYAGDGPLGTVMIAWHPSTQAARAVRASLPLIAGAADVRIAMVDPKPDHYGPNPGDDIAAWLARSGLTITVERLDGHHDSVSDSLLEHATDIGADMMVMGAFGRSRFREWLLGGTTREIVENVRVPVLMAH